MEQNSLTSFKDRYIYISLCVLVFLVYANSLGNDFVSDDRSGILFNPQVGEWSYVFRSFIGFGTAVFHLLIAQIFGLHAWVFRLFNIISHAAVVCCVYYLFKNLYDKKLGILVAFIFAVHPILTESITWIAGGGYVSYALFFLLSFILFLESEEKYDWKYFLSLVLYACAILTSEKAVSLAGIFVLYKFVYSQESRASFLKAASYLLVTLPFVLMLVGILGKRQEILQTEYYQEKGFVNPLYQIPIAVTQYIQLYLWPQGLTLYHSETIFSFTEYFIRLGFFLIILIPLFFFIYKLRGGIKESLMFWKNVNLENNNIYKKILDYKYYVFWFFFFMITMLPTMTPLKISWLVAERYSYLGMVGITAIIAFFLYKLLNLENIKMAVIGVIVIIIFALGMRTIYRNLDWRNEDTLWLSAAKYSPSSPNNHNNLGDYYSRHGDYNRAIEEFKYATVLKPNYADAFHNLAYTYQLLYENETDVTKKQQLFEFSKENYLNAIKYSPIIWQSHQNLAILYFQNGDNESGYKEYQTAMSINPGNPNLVAQYIQINIQIKNFTEAIKSAEYLVSLDPSNQQFQNILKQVKEMEAQNSQDNQNSDESK